MTLPNVSPRQLATMLAALRFYQAHLQADGTVDGGAGLSAEVHAIATSTEDGTCISAPMNAQQVDVLYERLSTLAV